MATPTEIEKIQNYYEINLSHAKWSFWASLASVVVGMVTLLSGVFILMYNRDYNSGMIATTAGILSEFISATFFYLYNKNMKQLNFFYEKLIKFQDTYWAMGLMNALPDDRKPKMNELIITQLITRNEPKTEMSPELVRAYAEAMKGRD